MEKPTYPRIFDEEFARYAVDKVEMKAAAELFWSTHINPPSTRETITTFLSTAVRPRRSIITNLVIGELIFTVSIGIFVNLFYHGSGMDTIPECIKQCLIFVIAPTFFASILVYLIIYRQYPKFPGHTEADILAEKDRQHALHSYNGPFQMLYKVVRCIGFVAEGVSAVSMFTVLENLLIKLIEVFAGRREARGDVPKVLVFLMEGRTVGWVVFATLTAAYGLVVLRQDMIWWIRMSEISHNRLAEAMAAEKERDLERDVEKGEVEGMSEIQL